MALASCITGLLNEFAWDDLPLILNDVRVHSLANWRLFFTASYWPPPYAAELYRPLSTSLYALEYVIGGGSPLLFRVVSYVLYAGVALAVLRLGRRLLPPRVALAIALLFAAHPVHTEPVALAVAQAELCVALIATALVMTYIDRRRSGTLDARAWTLIALGCAAAPLFKENGLVLPGLLLAAELCLLRDASARTRVAKLWPGYAALVAIETLALLARRVVLPGAESEAGTFVAEALQGLGAGGRALTMLQVVPRWLRLLSWPSHLQIDYSPAEILASTHVGATEVLGLAILVLAVSVAWLARRRAPAVTFGILWMAVSLLPVSNVLVPTGIVLAERTLMLPSVGFVIAVGGAVTLLLESRHLLAIELRRWLPAACVILVTAGVARSAWRQRDWVNNGVVWFKGSRDALLSYRTQEGAAIVLLQIGADSAAHVAFGRAIALSPRPQLVRNAYATLLRERGRDSAAVVQLRASLVEDPTQPTVRTELATALMGIGRYEEAAALAREAARRGESPAQAEWLAAVADSAKRAGAPAGAVRLRVRLKAVRAGYHR